MSASKSLKCCYVRSAVIRDLSGNKKNEKFEKLKIKKVLKNVLKFRSLNNLQYKFLKKLDKY